MKLTDKTKKIIIGSTIGTLAIALIVGGTIKYNAISSETKKANAGKNTVEVSKATIKSETSTTKMTEITTIEGNTTKTNNTSKPKPQTSTKSPVNNCVTTSTTSTTMETTTIKQKHYILNQALASKHGFTIFANDAYFSPTKDGYILRFQGYIKNESTENRHFEYDPYYLIGSDGKGNLLHIKDRTAIDVKPGETVDWSIDLYYAPTTPPSDEFCISYTFYDGKFDNTLVYLK